MTVSAMRNAVRGNKGDSPFMGLSANGFYLIILKWMIVLGPVVFVTLTVVYVEKS